MMDGKYMPRHLSLLDNMARVGCQKYAYQEAHLKLD